MGGCRTSYYSLSTVALAKPLIDSALQSNEDFPTSDRNTQITFSATFKHSISFIHKSISIYPSSKHPNTHRIIAVVGRLRLIIYIANPLWNICLTQDMLFSFNGYVTRLTKTLDYEPTLKLEFQNANEVPLKPRSTPFALIFDRFALFAQH